MNPVLTPEEIECRPPVLRAMSDLFLGTELRGFQYKFLARVVVEPGFPPREIHYISWKQVFPALADNLRVVAGEWAIFQDD